MNHMSTFEIKMRNMNHTLTYGVVLCNMNIVRYIEHYQVISRYIKEYYTL